MAKKGVKLRFSNLGLLGKLWSILIIWANSCPGMPKISSNLPKIVVRTVINHRIWMTFSGNFMIIR